MFIPFSLTHASMLIFISYASRRILSRSGTRLYSSDLVTSTKSTTAKKVINLLSKRKKRVEHGQVVVEGPRMIFDLWENPTTRPLFSQVILDPNKYDTSLFDDSTQVLTATQEVLEACTDTVANQGIVAICDIPDNSVKKSAHPLYLVADAIQDPGNLGTLVRSAAATGVSGVYILPESCDPWNPKAVRSAMGTTFNVPVIQASSWQECSELLKQHGCNTLLAATMLEDGTPGTSHYDVDWTTTPCAVVIGSEGNGLTDSVREAVRSGAVQAVHVPMEAGVESLNAAVCGSVIMFEYHRQRQLRERT